MALWTSHHGSTSMVMVYVAMLLSLFAVQASGAAYSITFTGGTFSNKTQNEMGVTLGHTNPSSNYIHWMDYLGITSVRYFMDSLQNWKKFINDKSQSWGTSFSGKIQITSESTWQDAVNELRAASSSPGQPEILEWAVATNPGVNWNFFKGSLGPQPPEKLGPIQACSGNPTQNLQAFRNANLKALVLWHATCKTLLLTSTDRNDPEYWAQRWELYRWFYLGGRFLASNGVKDIEIYNEPNLDPCMKYTVWDDEVRVRSIAFQDSYKDHSSWSGNAIDVNIIVPPMSAPSMDLGEGPVGSGRMAVNDVHTKFPGLEKSSDSWWNAKEFSYHQYNGKIFVCLFVLT